MKKVLMSLLTMGVMASAAMAGEWVSGELVYIELQQNGRVAIKIKNADGDEIWGRIAGSADSAFTKTFTAVALTALSTGRPVSAYKDGDYKRIFLKK
jgi:hypothetical protein